MSGQVVGFEAAVRGAGTGRGRGSEKAVGRRLGGVSGGVFLDWGGMFGEGGVGSWDLPQGEEEGEHDVDDGSHWVGFGWWMRVCM